jgi:GTPase SAR1 family protein
MDPMYQYQFRLILIGDSTVGKSSLLKYFTEGTNAQLNLCDATVGVDFYARLVQIKPNMRVKLQLWDTAGQEKFRYAAPVKCNFLLFCVQVHHAILLPSLGRRARRVRHNTTTDIRKCGRVAAGGTGERGRARSVHVRVYARRTQGRLDGQTRSAL